MATKRDGIQYIPIDDRDQSTVRAVILARSSNPSARPEDMKSQLDQCEDFVKDMGWNLTFPADTFTESKTGMRNVKRPVLDEVLKLAMRGEIDVIVCLRPARIARRAGKRYQAIETARDYGVEFRFPKYAAARGKYPGGVEGLLEQFKDDLYDEKEATEIADRLSPGRLARFRAGLPHGGGNGPNYGYKSGERRVVGKSERPMGVLKWEIDEDKAKWVRWMFDWVDEHPPAEVSLRGMARELDRKGVPSPTGGREWAATQIRYILRNAKYCGKGRGLRYRLTWETERDRESGMVHDVPRAHDLLRAAERVAKQDPDQADAAQAAYLLISAPETKPSIRTVVSKRG
jgi:DNA invertase Pin-like site-specific DNA recombinase